MTAIASEDQCLRWVRPTDSDAEGTDNRAVFWSSTVTAAAVTVVLIAVGAFIDLLPQALLLAAELTAVITFVFALFAHRRTGTAKEPVALAGAVVAAITPLVPLAAAIWPSAFGAEPPGENFAQAAEVLVGAVGTIVAAFVLRMFVRAPRA